MLHQLLVAVVVYRVQITLHCQTLLQPAPLLLPNAPAQLLVQTVGGFAGYDFRVFKLRQLQNVGAHGCQPLRLAHDSVRIGLPLLLGQVLTLQELGKAPDGDEGRFELVGKGIDKI